eukprot:gnl/MRDRNA2_/MRDRNA2_85392_c0_seq1.p1 gnl/MRDRNA2_/MRDRNA2_85392_c0~~gnl/MRDRNA2_/MRDRNA2_85392_c0_seq1.p1  ORF type:complete len:319 (+),score=48.18 gnl/MRDRNA2_/MRDRNA2_85392_c0_seq1:79-1035(+)
MKSFVFLLAISCSGVSALKLQEPVDEIDESLSDTGGSHVMTISLQNTAAQFARQDEGKPDVWAFFTTTQKRVQNVRMIVDMLKNQTHPPSHIIINCGTDDVLKEAGMHLEEVSNANSEVSNQFLEDIGPGTKYPSGKLLDQVPSHSYIFINDDDQLHNPILIEKLVETMEINRKAGNPAVAIGHRVRPTGDKAPGGRGRSHKSHCGDIHKLQFPFLYAYGGIVFRKNMLLGLGEFTKTIIEKEPMCKFVDDVYVSGYLFRSGIHVTQRFKDTGHPIGMDDKGASTGALVSTHDRGCENKACSNAVLAIDYPFEQYTGQ